MRKAWLWHNHKGTAMAWNSVNAHWNWGRGRKGSGRREGNRGLASRTGSLGWASLCSACAVAVQWLQVLLCSKMSCPGHQGSSVSNRAHGQRWEQSGRHTESADEDWPLTFSSFFLPDSLKAIPKHLLWARQEMMIIVDVTKRNTQGSQNILFLTGPHSDSAPQEIFKPSWDRLFESHSKYTFRLKLIIWKFLGCTG